MSRIVNRKKSPLSSKSLGEESRGISIAWGQSEGEEESECKVGLLNQASGEFFFERARERGMASSGMWRAVVRIAAEAERYRDFLATLSERARVYDEPRFTSRPMNRRMLLSHGGSGAGIPNGDGVHFLPKQPAANGSYQKKRSIDHGTIARGELFKKTAKADMRIRLDDW